MRRIALGESSPSHAAAAEAAQCLRAGGVIVAPTETVYGLMTRWANTDGRERIFAMKNRPAEKQLQMLAADLKTAVQHGVEPDERLDALAAAFWPGPLTVVCPSRPGGTVGLRIPDHAFMRALLAALDEPLAATSANLSGEPAAVCADQAIARLQAPPDLLVDAGPVRRGGRASTVILLEARGIKVLREGPVSADAITDTLSALRPR